jgi:iron complex transport system permease protein
MAKAETPVIDTAAGTASFLSKRWARYSAVLILLGIGVLLLLVLNVALGSVSIPLGDTVSILINGETSNDTYGPIIWSIRLPRAIGAIISGSALAVAGLVLQVFFRNPIVGPYILGISSGSSFVVSLFILTGFTVGASSINSLSLSLFAFIGAIMVMLLIMAVASRVKSVITLLVIGLMVGFTASAMTSFLIAFAESENVHRFVVWTMGSFSGMNWEEVSILAVAGGLLMVAAYFYTKPLNAFLLGENYAKSMGVNVRAFRYVVLLISSGLAAVVTAFAGPVAFIGLAVPHLTRLLLATSDNRILIPGVILAGALLASICDLLARMLFAPVELPISATTALFGAPLVLFLLLRKKGASI